ncbi:MAG: alpha/beta hydrolase [Gammaproteobacteria bacterium]|nr:alpha/beta hydrolase [Gammaproteobacteria bacterium]
MTDDLRFTDGHYSSSDGLRLFFRDYHCQSSGELDPVICLPGLTRNSRDFHDLAVLLSERRRVITTDPRGRGRSDYDADRSNYHPSQYVADVWELLDYLGVPRVIVIGTSMGGWMAMILAHQRPAAISGVVMNDVGPELDPAGLARVQASAGMLPPVADWKEAAARVRQHYESTFPDWPDSKWLDFAKSTYKESGDSGFDVDLDRNIGVALREGLSGLRHDPWQLFDALSTIPLLVLRGEISDILADATLSKMRERKTDMDAVVVPNRGHAPNLDEPEAINAIEKFLDQN